MWKWIRTSRNFFFFFWRSALPWALPQVTGYARAFPIIGAPMQSGDGFFIEYCSVA